MLHTTYDDWLHRGPYLYDMDLHNYIRFIQRERNGLRARKGELLSAEELMYSFSTIITFWHAAIGKLWATILARGPFR